MQVADTHATHRRAKKSDLMMEHLRFEPLQKTEMCLVFNSIHRLRRQKLLQLSSMHVAHLLPLERILKDLHQCLKKQVHA